MFLLSRLFVKPIHRLEDGARRISAGDFQTTLPVESRDEFGDLTKSFNEMSRSLRVKDDLLTQQRQENDRLLLSLMPESVAERYRRLRESGAIRHIRAALDLVAALPAEDPLAGKADMGHVAMSGHSFGTFTTWAIGGASLDTQHFKDACASGDLAPCSDAEHAALAGDLSDPRPQIIIPLAGAPNSEVGMGYDSTKVPVLMMDGSLNMVGNDTVWAAATKLDLTWVDVEGGCHQLFGLGNSVLGDPACKALPDEEGFALVNPWVLAYARYHVLDDRSEPVKGLVEGTTSLSPKVHVQHEGP